MSPFPGEFSADEGLTRSEIRAKKRRRMLRRRRTTTIVVICVLVFGFGGFFGLRAAGGVFDDLFGPKGDYEGQGTEEVLIEIAPGSSARTVANQLVEEGVIMNSEPFLDEVERRDATIQAGTWTMRKKMSSEAAVEALIDPIAPPKITVAEGKQVEEIKSIMIESGMSADQVDKAIDDKTPKDYGLDIDSPSLEGFLDPATYDLKKSKTAEDIVQELVERTENELDELGIDDEDSNRVLTLASLVEKESPGDEDVRKKVARVFLNRISDDSRTGGTAAVRRHRGLHPRCSLGSDDDEEGAAVGLSVQHIQEEGTASRTDQRPERGCGEGRTRPDRGRLAVLRGHEPGHGGDEVRRHLRRAQEERRDLPQVAQGAQRGQ